MFLLITILGQELFFVQRGGGRGGEGEEKHQKKTMVCNRLCRILFLDENTATRNEIDTRMVFILMTVASVGAMSTLPEVIPRARDQVITTMGFGISLVALTATPIALCCGLRVTPNSMAVVSAVLFAGVWLQTLSLSTLGEHNWMCLVLVFDFLLIMRVDHRVTLGAVGVTIGWLCIQIAEESYRFGILDLPGFPPQHGKYGRREAFAKLVECELLPCATGLGVGMRRGLVAVSVLLLDFVATRGFALQVQREQEVMQQTIKEVQKIAVLLAEYDVDTVASLLMSAEGLPQEMTAALRALERNLRVYKPFLPKTCFSFDADEPKEKEVENSDDDTISQSSHSDQTSDSTFTPSVHRSRPLALTSAPATLFLANIKNSLSRLETEDVSMVFTVLLEHTLRAVEAQRGMVDVFIGDKVYCSFNASRGCVTHAGSALHAANALISKATPLDGFNIGIASGVLHRGDMGCEMMRRFSIFGELLSEVRVIERSGSALNIAILCNKRCFAEGVGVYTLRLIPFKIPFRGRGLVIAELLPATLREQGEWMYVLGATPDWDLYNTSVKAYLSGDSLADSVSSAGDKGAVITTFLAQQDSIRARHAENSVCAFASV